jgi:hypothetical protein
MANQDDAKLGEVESEMKIIKILVGKIESRDEIASASHLMDSLRNFSAMPLDQVKYTAWKEHIRRHCDEEITWAEISIFRMTGEVSSFFLDGQEVKDTEFMKELKTVVENWVSMVARGGLKMFEPCAAVYQVKDGDGSVLPAAATLRAYMQLYKCQVAFPEWTRDFVCEARFHFCRIRGQFQQDLKRPSLSSGKSYFCYFSQILNASLTAAQTTLQPRDLGMMASVLDRLTTVPDSKHPAVLQRHSRRRNKARITR